MVLSLNQILNVSPNLQIVIYLKEVILNTFYRNEIELLVFKLCPGLFG